jgi:hypothetical protein
MRALLGVNLPYLYGSYGHDLAPSARHPDWPCDFDALAAYRPLLEAKQLGLDAVRIWLCEGAEGLIADAAGRITGVHPKLLESIRMIEEGAAIAGVRLYFCLLDANGASRDGDELTRSILADPDQAARFAERVVAPLARALDPEVLFGLEIVNEPEVVTESCRDIHPDPARAPVPWSTVGAMIAAARRAARAEKIDLLVTSGTGHVFLPELWKSGAELSAVDIHMYHLDGGLPPRADLAKYVGDPALESDDVPLIAGECGIPKPEGDDPLALSYYLMNADKNGYAAAFLWKLEGDLIDAKAPKRPFTAVAEHVRSALDARPASGFAR